MSEVFDALEKNNANTGGSYIEENSNQYFIRGIGVVKVWKMWQTSPSKPLTALLLR